MATPEILTPGSLLTHATPLIENANNVLGQSRRAEISTKDDFDKAIDVIKVCTAEEKRATEALGKLVDPLTGHVKWIRDQFKPVFDALAEAKALFKQKALKWEQAEKKRQDEAAAELQRLAEEQALADAKAAQDSGDTERADNLLNLAAATPAAATGVKGRGAFTGASGSTKYTWIGEVVSVKDICAAIAEGKLPESVIKEISKTRMNTFAKDHHVEGVFFGIKVTKKADLNVR